MLAIRVGALVLLLTAVVPSAVARAEEGPPGNECYAAAVGEYDSTHHTSVVGGGPLAGTGTLTCSLQYGDAHSAPDIFTATATGTDVVVVPPHRASYDLINDVYLCTAFTPTGGATLYLTRHWDGGVRWSTDPASSCAPGNHVEPVLRAIRDSVYCQMECPWDWTAQLTCSVLQSLAPGVPPVVTGGAVVYVDREGDVFIDDGGGITEARWRETMFWDCPGYVDFESHPWAPGNDGIPVIDV